jgi:pantoate--beta-alanine ligase
MKREEALCYTVLSLSPRNKVHMPSRPRVVRSLPMLRNALARLRAGGHAIALVPTMGALHAGHLSLVRLARARGRRVVVSIFVNPAQFAPNEDFANYPRRFEQDVTALAGVDLIWAPTVEAMYPKGFATRIVPEGPAQAKLEDAFRPHFFGGVATVVTKLLTQCAPDVAVFGEKDYQQLLVIKRLVADLDLPVKIIGAPIVREKDGLAMSSRNAYLSGAERVHAPMLHATLQDCARRIDTGEVIARALDEGAQALESEGFAVDYFEARHAQTLAKVDALNSGPIRLLAAARLGRTRLIDNVAL